MSFADSWRRTTAVAIRKAAQTIYPISRYYQQFLGFVGEPFTGAWQRNLSTAAPQNVLGFSAVYACLSLISDDISKLRIMLTKEDPLTGIQTEVRTNSLFLKSLETPNPYQTRQQFLVSWMVSLLSRGNTYIYKAREDLRGVVTGLYPLDPCLVTPLMAQNGDVYYRLGRDYLSGIEDDDTVVPASEIIHDRMITLWHPLIGVSPLFACGQSALLGLSIESNSTQFFANMSRPSGLLTAPGKISDETAERLKTSWQTNFSAGNLGKLAVLGDGLTYTPMTIPAHDAQLVEQLRMTVDQVARCFHVPVYKIGLPANMTLGNSAQYDQDYYAQCLQARIEAIEALLRIGLELPPYYDIELDTDGLTRMDPLGQAETQAKRIGAGEMAPNEARKKNNLPPVKGGDSPYLQVQNYSLEALAKRDAKEDPFTTASSSSSAPKPTNEAPALPPPKAAEPIQILQPVVPALDVKQLALELVAALPKPDEPKEKPPTAQEFAEALMKEFREAASAI